jgi:hypothetical protein
VTRRTGEPDVAQVAEQRVDAIGPRPDRSPYGVGDPHNAGGDVADERRLTVGCRVGHRRAAVQRKSLGGIREDV